ncbi:hypothetical protein VTL71DRAFT_2388 [Oculimacula yallundae]|uniref:Secreted protein n=1 Tax=Oculimacula yallundae TaxID=86028 RepID=A0ABR4C9Y2_9HELO
MIVPSIIVLAIAGIVQPSLGWTKLPKTVEHTADFFETEGCVDQIGFLNCGKARKAYTTDRRCQDFEEDFNCFNSFCWNKVYTCQYQQEAITYLDMCSGKSKLPFFPAPYNATNDCSCNFGQVDMALQGAKEKGKHCRNHVKGQNRDLQVEHCNCCVISESYAILDAICPNISPLDIGHDTIQEIATNLHIDLHKCDEYVSRGKCIEELSFPLSLEGIQKPLTYLDYSGMASFTNSLNATAVTNNPGTLLAPPTSDGYLFKWTRAAYGFGNHHFKAKTHTITARSATVTGIDSEVTKVADFSPTPTPTPTATTSYQLRLGSKSAGVINRAVDPVFLTVLFPAVVLGFVV